MNDFGGISERLLELTHEPLTAATRAEFDSLLAELPPADQARWRALRAEADLLHAHFAQRTPPEALPDLPALLALPPEEAPPTSLPFQQPDARPAQRPGMSLRSRVIVYAASIILIVGSVSWWYLNQQPKGPQPLAAATANKLAAAAVALHESNPKLDITSPDLAAVATALKASPMPFAPILPNPRVKMDLLGGGHTTLDGMPCLFTRWKYHDTICTLCQFDGKPENLPPNFASTHTAPQALWHDALHYQVIFWPGPGGSCTWALVLENESTPDAFSSAY